MNALIVVLVVLLAALSSHAKSISNKELDGRITDPSENDPLRVEWLLWQDDQGVVHNESLVHNLQANGKGTIHDVKLHLYTRNNLAEAELIDPANLTDILNSTQFNLARSVKRRNVFIIHGWNNDASSPVNQLIKTAMLDMHDVNVFVVDWGVMASNFYTTSMSVIPGIGAALAGYIDEVLAHYNLSSNDVMLVGHSLGAHVAGAVGAAMASKPNLIVGLDPAGPLFSLSDTNKRLDVTDAKHVQIIHTSGGKLAFKSSLGHSDFFPNGGQHQPGCGLDLFGSCAHSRSYRYYAESIKDCTFKAVHCKSFDDFEDGLCENNLNSFLGCFDVDTQASGDFFLATRKEEPFVIQNSLINNLKTRKKTVLVTV